MEAASGFPKGTIFPQYALTVSGQMNPAQQQWISVSPMSQICVIIRLLREKICSADAKSCGSAPAHPQGPNLCGQGASAPVFYFAGRGLPT